MKILVVTATKDELPIILRTTDRYNHLFDVLITGVGMVATALSLGQALSRQTYCGILNLGIAGSFRKDIALGDPVRIQKDVLSELGAEDDHTFRTIEILGFGQSTFEERPFQAHMGSIDTLKRVNGITVNTVHGNKESIHMIQNRLDPDVESMEGAAVFYAAQTFKIPCMQIRTISNYVETRNKDKWELAKAIDQLNTWFGQFLKNYQSNQV